MAYPLVVKEIRKSYFYRGNGETKIVPALNGVSFKVKNGEVLGLLGPNGAGKTTLINIITGILLPDSGNIKFFGRERDEETQNKINAATAYLPLHGHLTVYQNLNIYRMLYGIKRKEAIDELLSRYGILDLKNKRVHDLSTGQSTRVSLCKSLINDPELLLLDEATAGLDPDIAANVRDDIKNLGTTIIFTSHFMQEVEEMCDRIAFMKDGRIIHVGTSANLKKLVSENFFEVEFLSAPKGGTKILRLLGAAMSGRKAVLKLDSDGDLDRVIHKLVRTGFKIKDVHIRRPSLDDVFVKISRGEL